MGLSCQCRQRRRCGLWGGVHVFAGSVIQPQSRTREQPPCRRSWRNFAPSSISRSTPRSSIKDLPQTWSSVEAKRRCCCCCSAAAAAPAPAGEVRLSPGWESVCGGGRERESGLTPAESCGSNCPEPFHRGSGSLTPRTNAAFYLKMILDCCFIGKDGFVTPGSDLNQIFKVPNIKRTSVLPWGYDGVKCCKNINEGSSFISLQIYITGAKWSE